MRIQKRDLNKSQGDLNMSANDSANTVEILQKALATNYVLYVKLDNFHWNVKGMHFIELHRYFGELYDSMGDTIDMVAERIRALQSNPVSSMAEFLVLSGVKEQLNKNLTEKEMLSELIADYSTIVDYLSLNCSNCDKVTENFLLSIIEGAQKTIWFLRSLNF